MAFTADDPDWILGCLEVNAYLFKRKLVVTILLSVASFSYAVDHKKPIRLKRAKIVKVKVKSAYEPSGSSSRSYPGFYSINTRNIATTPSPPPPGWDASPLL